MEVIVGLSQAHTGSEEHLPVSLEQKVESPHYCPEKCQCQIYAFVCLIGCA